MSSVIQAQGQRNLSNSQAAINLTDARSNQIDNQVKSVNAFWEKKDIYDAHVQQELAAIDKKRDFYLGQPWAQNANARRVRSHYRHDLLAEGSQSEAVR